MFRTSVPLSLLLVACSSAPAHHAAEHDPGNAFAVVPPPGAGDLVLSAPSTAVAGDVITLSVTSPTLADGDRVDFGYGTAEGSGICPYRGTTGGSPCLEITGRVRELGSVTASGPPGSATAELTTRLVTGVPVAWVQAFLLRGGSSATSQVIGVTVTQPFAALDPRVATLETTTDAQSMDIDALELTTSGQGTDISTLQADVDDLEIAIADPSTGLAALSASLSGILGDYLTSASLAGYATMTAVTSAVNALSTAIDTRLLLVEGDLDTVLANYGTVSSVGTSGGLAGGPITGTGTISIADDGVGAAKLASEVGSLDKVSGGVLAATTTGTGRLGVGRDDPQAALDVVGGAQFEGVPDARVGSYSTNASPGFSGFEAYSGVDSLGGFLLVSPVTGATSHLSSAGNRDTYLTTRQPYNLLFGTNTTERMRVTSSGRVGVATTTPQETFAVQGSVAQTSSDGVKGSRTLLLKVDRTGPTDYARLIIPQSYSTTNGGGVRLKVTWLGTHALASVYQEYTFAYGTHHAVGTSGGHNFMVPSSVKRTVNQTSPYSYSYVYTSTPSVAFSLDRTGDGSASGVVMALQGWNDSYGTQMLIEAELFGQQTNPPKLEFLGATPPSGLTAISMIGASPGAQTINWSGQSGVPVSNGNACAQRTVTVDAAGPYYINGRWNVVSDVAGACRYVNCYLQVNGVALGIFGDENDGLISLNGPQSGTYQTGYATGTVNLNAGNNTLQWTCQSSDCVALTMQCNRSHIDVLGPFGG